MALMAKIVCEIHNSDDRFDWTGFYRVTEPRVLKIGPYQGGHGCLHIAFIVAYADKLYQQESLT